MRWVSSEPGPSTSSGFECGVCKKFATTPVTLKNWDTKEWETVWLESYYAVSGLFMDGNHYLMRFARQTEIEKFLAGEDTHPQIKDFARSRGFDPSLLEDK